MNRQLVIGLGIGIFATALVTVVLTNLFDEKALSVSDSDNFKFLAQVSLEDEAASSESGTVTLVAAVTEDTPDIPEKISPPASRASKPESSSEPTLPPPAPAKIQACAYVSANSVTDSPVILNEVAWMGDSESSNHEWIELKNRSAVSADISRWQLIDKSAQIEVVIPEGTTLPAGGFLIAKRGSETLPGVSGLVYVGALSNEDEGLKLFNAACVTQDQALADPRWGAGDASEKRTMERGSDMTWHTYYGSGNPSAGSGQGGGILGTPNKENSVPPPPVQIIQNNPPPPASPPPAALPPPSQTGPILITEVSAGSEASVDDEFVELYNPNAFEIDLTGYSIKKRSSTGTESSLVSATRLEGKKIPAGKHFLIGHEGKYAGAVTLDATWATSYSLAYTNNAVILYGANNQKIIEASWSEIPKGSSYECNLGSCAVQSVPTPQNSLN